MLLIMKSFERKGYSSNKEDYQRLKKKGKIDNKKEIQNSNRSALNHKNCNNFDKKSLS